ncbi:MAG: LptE family protein [Bacteroidales bacterium]|nr:LptE family protein [Bacteroidales bacterium]
MIRRKHKIIFHALVSLLMMTLITGCGVYSFTGASISPETKTISIDRFPNNAMTVEPTLSQKFTDALRDKFQNETNLVMLNKGGDLQLEGSITGYRTSPVAIQANETAAMNRLTITVEVSFTNTIDDSQSFKSSFSRYQDYSSTQDLNAVKDGLIDEINEMLVQDIFNKAVVNW